MEKTEARILIRHRPGNRVELSVFDPKVNREHRTGLVVPLAQLDAEVRKLKSTLERAGSRVTVKEM